MRKLTQKEIDDAPSWAVSYDIDLDQVNAGPVVSYHERHYGFTLPLPHTAPRKEFDIDTYEPDDVDIIICSSSDERINFATYNNDTIFMTKDDYIAGAKHFKLTAEDLK